MDFREGPGPATEEERYLCVTTDQNTDEERSSTNQSRGNRFVQSNAKDEIFLSRNMNDLKPYYNGEMLTSRMRKIREHIVYIRKNWEKFDSFLENLKIYMERNGFDFEAELGSGLEAKSFLRKRDWGDRNTDLQDGSFEVVSLYTDDDVYKSIFRLLSKVFRSEESPELENIIRNAVFLTELMNIDLFNYCLNCPEKSNFEGTVYRGMGITNEELNDFEKLRTMTAKSRYIAIPLSLMSSTSDLDVAEEFMEENLTREREKQGLLYKIHVINLKKEYLHFYRKRFPSSVVSTICAVDIADLSVFESESEVLLRGAFLQVLDIYKSANNLAGRPYYILEVVMLNTNRDHISTAFLGEDDAAARTLFGIMVGETRATFAYKYYNQRGIFEDADEMKHITEEYQEKLKVLMV